MHSSTYVITINYIKYICTLLVINDETSTVDRAHALSFNCSFH